MRFWAGDADGAHLEKRKRAINDPRCPVCPGQAVPGLCAGGLQAPGAARVSGAAASSIPRGGRGYRLALRPARDSGISSGMARLGQALFWGSRCLGFLMSFPRDCSDQLGL